MVEISPWALHIGSAIRHHPTYMHASEKRLRGLPSRDNYRVISLQHFKCSLELSRLLIQDISLTPPMNLYLVAALLLGAANAHTIGQKLSVNGVEQSPFAGVRVPKYSAVST
jgi:hypothetical protein